MSSSDDRLEALRKAIGRRGDAARPDIVTRIHDKGRLTASERMHLLADPESSVPYGTIAATDPTAEYLPWVAETGGLDAICAIDGQPTVISTTNYSDSGGGYGAARIGRLLALV